MVIQRSWKIICDAASTSASSTEANRSPSNSSSDDSNCSNQTTNSISTSVAASPPTSINDSSSTPTMEMPGDGRSSDSSDDSLSAVVQKYVTTSQMAAMTLQRLKQRLGCPIPSSNPSNEGAMRSLELLRISVQASFDKEVDTVMKRFMESYFKPAFKNIKENLGPNAVSEDSLQKMSCALLENAKAMYAVRQKPQAASVYQSSHAALQTTQQATPRPTAHSVPHTTAHTVMQTRAHSASQSARYAVTQPTRHSAPQTGAHPAPQSTRHSASHATRQQTTQPTRHSASHSTRQQTPQSARHPAPQPTRHPAPQHARHSAPQSTPRAQPSVNVVRLGTKRPAQKPNAAELAKKLYPATAATAAVIQPTQPAQPSPPVSSSNSNELKNEANSASNATSTIANVSAPIARTSTSYATVAPVLLQQQLQKPPAAPVLPSRRQIFWNTATISTTTRFVLDVQANQAFGFGTDGRERLASKHPELIRYLPDNDDRDWLIAQNIISALNRNSRFLFLIFDEVCRLQQTNDLYRFKVNIDLTLMHTFTVPDFMIQKMKHFFVDLNIKSRGLITNSFSLGAAQNSHLRNALLQGATGGITTLSELLGTDGDTTASISAFGLAALADNMDSSNVAVGSTGNGGGASSGTTAVLTRPRTSTLSSSHATLTALLNNSTGASSSTGTRDKLVTTFKLRK